MVVVDAGATTADDDEPPPLDIRLRRSSFCWMCISDTRSGQSGIDTLGGTTCRSSLIRGTNDTGSMPGCCCFTMVVAAAAAVTAAAAATADPDTNGRDIGGIGRAVTGGADSIDVSEGLEEITGCWDDDDDVRLLRLITFDANDDDGPDPETPLLLLLLPRPGIASVELVRNFSMSEI